MKFKRIADIPSQNAASLLDSALNSLLVNGKRSYSNFCGELVIMRAKKEDQALNLEHFPEEEPEWRRATCNIMEDVPPSLSQNSHRRQGRRRRRIRIPIGMHHQADLPQWTPPDFKSSGGRSDISVIDIDEARDDKRLGTCVTPMPRHHPTPMEIQICISKKDCDCTDESSIRCVRQHVMEAREKLRGALGQNKFKKLGFLDMGEDVAQRWTAEEENLFRMAVLSNSTSLGRNFWTALSRSFPYRSFKEIVSYYFNVFILLKRADQNHIDPLNADSDNDEWLENSDEEEEEDEEDEDEEEEDSGVESPAYGNSPTLDDDEVSEELDFEYENHLVRRKEDEGFYCGFGGSMGYKQSSPIDRYSRYCSFDQDDQDDDDSSTSLEEVYNALGSNVKCKTVLEGTFVSPLKKKKKMKNDATNPATSNPTFGIDDRDQRIEELLRENMELIEEKARLRQEITQLLRRERSLAKSLAKRSDHMCGIHIALNKIIGKLQPSRLKMELMEIRSLMSSWGFAAHRAPAMPIPPLSAFQTRFPDGRGR